MIRKDLEGESSKYLGENGSTDEPDILRLKNIAITIQVGHRKGTTARRRQVMLYNILLC